LLLALILFSSAPEASGFFLDALYFTRGYRHYCTSANARMTSWG